MTLLELKMAGRSDKECAELLGTTVKAIKSRIQRMRARGVDVPSRHTVLLAQVKTLFDRGLCGRAIAAEVGSGSDYVCRLLKELGLDVTENAEASRRSVRRAQGREYDEARCARSFS